MNNKVETTSTTTNTSNTYNWRCPWYSPPHSTEYGWQCPRCGKVNAPWMPSCNCSNNWNITWTSDHVNIKPNWWKEVTCHDDNIMNNPTTYTTAYNDVVGGSDYPDGQGGYTNIPKNCTNKVK